MKVTHFVVAAVVVFGCCAAIFLWPRKPETATSGEPGRDAFKFERLDDNARAYGHIIWSSLLNIGEIIGVPAYVAMINRQPPEIQQRIRDFLLYPDPSPEGRAAADEAYPGLFPSEYRFGHGNPVFVQKPQPDN